MKKMTNKEIQKEFKVQNNLIYLLSKRIGKLQIKTTELETESVKTADFSIPGIKIKSVETDGYNLDRPYEDCKIKLKKDPLLHSTFNQIKLKTVGPEVKGKQYLEEAKKLLNECYITGFREFPDTLSIKLSDFMTSYNKGEIKKWRDQI